MPVAYQKNRFGHVRLQHEHEIRSGVFSEGSPQMMRYRKALWWHCCDHVFMFSILLVDSKAELCIGNVPHDAFDTLSSKPQNYSFGFDSTSLCSCGSFTSIVNPFVRLSTCKFFRVFSEIIHLQWTLTPNLLYSCYAPKYPQQWLGISAGLFDAREQSCTVIIMRWNYIPKHFLVSTFEWAQIALSTVYGSIIMISQCDCDSHTSS